LLVLEWLTRNLLKDYLSCCELPLSTTTRHLLWTPIRDKGRNGPRGKSSLSGPELSRFQHPLQGPRVPSSL